MLAQFTLATWILAFAFVFVLTDSALAAERPNIVFLFADDLGSGDLHCTGHPYARTPNLDQLAKDGTRFAQFYVTGVTCCPSRTGFMTGKFPATFAKYPANAGFGDRVTITQVLKQGGYATGHFGKWHIGPDEKPGTYGVDVIPGENQAAAKRDERGRDAPVYDAAIRFIEEHKDQPFYVNVWGHTTHHPVDPPSSFAEKFRDVAIRAEDFPPFMQEKFAISQKRGGDTSAGMRNYLGDVLALDECVGRLLKKIDELGLRERTMVVFSSDQGAPAIREQDMAKDNKRNADLRFNLMGYNGGLRGGKHNMYEGGVRSPFIVRWPNHVPAGRVDDKSVISGIDWFPTLARLCNVPLPAVDFDGEDTSAAWLGQKIHVRQKPLLWKTSNPRSEIAIRAENWKLHFPNKKRGEVELFDLATDERETKNLADEKLEVVKKLLAQVKAWDATLPTAYEKTDDRQD